MNDIWTVIAMGTGVYALRLTGFALPVAALPDRWKRALQALPVALLAALVASSRAGFASGDPARMLALIAGGYIAWRFRRIWLVIIVAMTVYWTTRWTGWGG